MLCDLVGDNVSKNFRVVLVRAEWCGDVAIDGPVSPSMCALVWYAGECDSNYSLPERDCTRAGREGTGCSARSGRQCLCNTRVEGARRGGLVQNRVPPQLPPFARDRLDRWCDGIGRLNRWSHAKRLDARTRRLLRVRSVHLGGDSAAWRGDDIN